jgi:hypothetical protein
MALTSGSGVCAAAIHSVYARRMGTTRPAFNAHDATTLLTFIRGDL